MVDDVDGAQPPDLDFTPLPLEDRVWSWPGPPPAAIPLAPQATVEQEAKEWVSLWDTDKE